MSKDKSLLRKHFLEIRSAVSDVEAAASASKAAYHFLNSVPLQHVRTLALYSHIPAEISLAPLIDAITNNAGIKIELCLPAVVAKNQPMVFYKWKPGEKLVNNILYPKVTEPEKNDQPVFPDMIIVPLVAFDKSCNRVGYGAGFYDRTIRWLEGKDVIDTLPPLPKGYRVPDQNNKHPFKIGYAYDCQKSYESIITDEYDEPLDIIITDKNIYYKK